jgi:hypothetical protein
MTPEFGADGDMPMIEPLLWLFSPLLLNRSLVAGAELGSTMLAAPLRSRLPHRRSGCAALPLGLPLPCSTKPGETATLHFKPAGVEPSIYYV